MKEGVAKEMATIAAETGARVKNLETFFVAQNEKHEKVLEIGLIRFPSQENPYIQLFRMQVTAWFICSRVLFVQKDRAGFDLELDVMKFKPIDAVVAKISDEMSTKIADKLSEPGMMDFS